MYTLEMMLNDLGGNVSFDQSGVFKVGGRPLSDLSGSCPKLNQILQAAGCNVSATEVRTVDKNKLKNRKCYYIIYSTADTGGSNQLRTGSAHWTCITDYNEGKILVLCNGKRDAWQPESEFIKLKYIYEVPR